MRIEINPRSLLNLENICEVLYKLHPSVLDDLVEMERSLGNVLGFIDLDNLSLEEREFLSRHFQKEDYSNESITQDDNKEDSTSRQLKYNTELEEYKNSIKFHNLRKYLQLDTDEYIAMKIYVEVEDPVIGKKVRELVEALEKTRAPEQFYLNKKEMDEYAYFAEGYDLTMNEEQKRQSDDFFDEEDAKALEILLKKEKLYP